jgi:hypothetical protein
LWRARVLAAKDECEELRQGIGELFSDETCDICKENMELKFRIMDLKRALEAIAGSTDAATAAVYLAGRTCLDLPRGTKQLVMNEVKEIYERECGAGSFGTIGSRRARGLEDEDAWPAP